MSRKNKIGLIAIVVLTAILLVWAFSGGNEKDAKGGGKNGSAAVYTNWDERYDLSGVQPLDLYHWNALLQLHLNKGKKITTIDYLYSIDTIPRTAHPTFMFVGDHFALYKEEADTLFSRVRNGANLFIAQEKMDGFMYYELFDFIRTGFYYDTTITIATSKRTYTFTSRFQSFAVAKKWNGYKETEMLDSMEFKPLSGYGTLMNSGVIEYGKGKIYLNTTPELFTNYQLLTKDGYEYSKIWLNEIPKDESIYWLELARYKEPEYNPWDDFNDSGRDSSYLQYIFQDKNRVLALTFLIAGLILFLLFRAKRMQPLVPFIPKKRNMTLIFADTITSIYFNQRNPHAMVKIQQSTFYSIVLKHFNIDVSKKEVSDKEIESLSQKSNVSEEEIKTILKQLKSLKVYNTTEPELSELRKMILNFYRNAGLISARVQEKLEQKTYVVYRNEWVSGLMILVGMGLMTYGTYLLVHAIAVGVLLWPVGMFPVILGIRRLMRPFLSWSNKEVRLSPFIGKEKTANLEQLTSVYQDDKQVQLHFMNGEVLRIEYKELNRADAKQFRRFVEAHNKLK